MSGAAVNPGLLLRLPHREPFLFLSELLELDPGRFGRGLWRITGREEFFRGHFPDNPLVPGVLLGESLAQLAGVVAFHDGDSAESAVRLGRIDIKLLRPVLPPADIQLEATLKRRMDAMILFDVRAMAGGETAAVGSLVLARAGGGGISAVSAAQGDEL